jgi:phage/conjugal plasmid C-4 type zinc finger TraR family protein
VTEERHIEASEAVVEQERVSGIARIQRALMEIGETECVDCGDPISARRRNAMPSAKRCIDCQSNTERASRGY